MAPTFPIALVLPVARALTPYLQPLTRSWVRAMLFGPLLWWLYTDLAHTWVGVPTRSSQLYGELPLLVSAYGLGYWALRPGAFRAVVASLPLLELYLLHDAYYAVFGRVMRVADFRLLVPLAEVMDGVHLALLLTAMVLPMSLFLWRLNWRIWPRPLMWLTLTTVLWTVPLWAPSLPLRWVGQSGPVLVPFSDLRNVENHGRVLMLLRLEAARQDLLPRLDAERKRHAVSDRNAAVVRTLAPTAKRPNIHLVVLESFVDPTFFDALALPVDPAHPRYRALIGARPGLIRSAVFGGKTAQAEFEILCGVRAWERYAPSEFLTMTGAPSPCLPRLLEALGYRTVASNAYRPNYFNATHAYGSLGFTEIHFPKAYAPGRTSYLRLTEDPDWYLFDGELLRQNLDYVRKIDRPVFNYILGVYGHSPFALEGRHQVFDALPGDPEPSIWRLVNQFHHRTQAVAAFVDDVFAHDPEAMVIVTSDHLPPLPSGTGGYATLGYLDGHPEPLLHNVLLVFRHGRVVSLPTLAHWMLPSLILDHISEGRFCADFPCPHRQPGAAQEDDLAAYTEIMAKASR